jgi:hypothetical protein
MAFAHFSTWLAGIANGYEPTSITRFQQFTIMSVSFGMHAIKFLGSQKTPIPNPNTILASLFLGLPVVIGSTFCMGTVLGKSARSLKNSELI